MSWRFLRLVSVSVPKQSCNASRHISTIRPLNNEASDLSLQWLDRSHWCGKVTEQNVGEKVRLTGWIQYSRIDTRFLLLKDWTGVVQLIIPEDETGDDSRERLKNVGPESNIKAVGTVRLRPEGDANPKMKTGMIEIDVETIEFANPANKKLPFIPSRPTNEANEPLRLKHRSLDLRSPNMQHNLRLRSEVEMKMSNFLWSRGFVKIGTPTLFRRTPGGAREFVVPTRQKDKFYSLVQSPQQFKQMLMVGGHDKYFQIASCYRDEGTKPDRQPEFTQIDIEMAWCSRTSIQNCIEEMLQNCWPSSNGDSGSEIKRLVFERKTYRECMDNYGVDKPDLRFENKIQDWTEHFSDSAATSFIEKVPLDTYSVKAVVFQKGIEYIASASELKRLEKEVLEEIKLTFGSTQIFVGNFKVTDTNQVTCSLVKKFFPSLISTLCTKVNLRNCDFGFLVIGNNTADVVSICAGKLRTRLSKLLYDLDPSDLRFLWVEDFPMFLPKEVDSSSQSSLGIESAHHPFTQPHPEDEHLLLERAYIKNDIDRLLKIRSLHYDLVLNGQEIGGGSIRIHDPNLQKFVLEDILNEDISELHHLLESLSYGAPPHGGIALGFDRLMSIMCKAATIRDVIAFPKGGEGKCLMSNAPANITDDQKSIYHIKVMSDEKETN